MKYLIIGLGNFGSSLAKQLVQLGHEVIGVDHKMELVERHKEQITHTIALDAANADAIRQLPLEGTEAAIISIGEDEGVSVMVAALLKQVGVKRIICRVTSPLQQIVFEAMNIEEFVYPEESSAERLAFRLDVHGVLNSFRYREDYRMLELKVPQRYIGKTIQQVHFEEKYHLVFITLVRDSTTTNLFGKEVVEHTVMGTCAPDTKLLPGDVLLLFGKNSDLKSFAG